MKLFSATIILAALVLSACTTVSPEARVRKNLIDAGLSPRMAGCMAERMTDQLSIDQLLKLRSLAHLRGRDMDEISVNEFVRRLRALQDPEIVSVVSRAGIGCAIAG